MALVADDEVDVEGLQQVGGSDEHLVAHDQHRVSRVLGVLADLVGLDRGEAKTDVHHWSM